MNCPVIEVNDRLWNLLAPRASDGREGIIFINDLIDNIIAALRHHPDLRGISRFEIEVLLASTAREAKSALVNKLRERLDLYDTLDFLNTNGFSRP
jgi:hypothetical protein